MIKILKEDMQMFHLIENNMRELTLKKKEWKT